MFKQGIVILMLLMLVGCTPEDVSQAEGDLNVFYHHNKQYADKGIDCDSTKFDGQWFIFCESDMAAHAHGSIFMVDENSRGGYRLYTVNAAARRAASSAFRLPLAEMPTKYRLRYSPKAIRERF